MASVPTLNVPPVIDVAPVKYWQHFQASMIRRRLSNPTVPIPITPVCVLAPVFEPVSVTLNAPVMPPDNVKAPEPDASIAPPEAVNVWRAQKSGRYRYIAVYPHLN